MTQSTESLAFFTSFDPEAHVFEEGWYALCEDGDLVGPFRTALSAYQWQLAYIQDVLGL